MSLCKTDKLTKLDKKNAKKILIADTAFKLFLKNGYISTKIIDIAEAVGIGKGTVYEYFPSKENILIYLIENVIVPSYEEIKAEVDKQKDVKEKLKAYIKFEHDFIKRFGVYCNDVKIQLFQADAHISEEIFNAILKIHIIQQQVMMNIVSYGIEKKVFRPINPDLLVTSILSMISFSLTGCNFKKYLENDTITFSNTNESVQDDVFDIILNGIGYRE